ncbi:MAG: DUF5103 domain-containing protein [Muribaculaceae bacterium]|nr:DUF5103 domain-containing protein [Muribaculaceae bacterium]
MRGAIGRKALHMAIAIAAMAVGHGATARAATTATAIFEPMIRTLTVTANGDLMADPVLRLGSNDRIVFSFDEISDDWRYLRCRLLHCNADWQPSGLVESEYVDGFNYAQIEDYAFSRNTYIHYVNYRFELGGGELRPLVSGNYLWQVYDESDPDTVLLQARFRVSEENCRISGKADGRTDKGFNTEWQQLSLYALPTSRDIGNPYTDMIVEVTQNGRPDTSRIIAHPQRVEGDRMIYEHLPGLVFEAGNEYRRFETVRNDYPGMHVDSVRYEDPMYQAFVTVDESRADRNYSYDSTQRGRYKIDEYNSTDPDLGADYILTHFTLDFPEVTDGSIYLEGDLALRGYTDFNRMKYDRQTGLYHLSVPLKQGSYNYQYVVRRNPDSPCGDVSVGGNYGSGTRQGSKVETAGASVVEGNHYETVNEYNVYVYLRQPGSRADRLIGAATIVATP